MSTNLPDTDDESELEKLIGTATASDAGPVVGAEILLDADKPAAQSRHCGLELRPVQLSDFLILLRHKNPLVDGRTGTADETLFAGLEVLFLLSIPCPKQAVKMSHVSAQEWQAQVEEFAATLPGGNVNGALRDAIEILANSTDTQVSAKAPSSPSASRGKPLPKND